MGSHCAKVHALVSSRRMPAPTRVLVADRHSLVRAGLRVALQDEVDLVIAGEASSASGTVERLRAGALDVMVLDLALAGWDGLALLKELRTAGIAVPTLVLSAYHEDWLAARTLRAGVLGYLTVDAAFSEVAPALRAVARGERYVVASLAERVAVALEGPVAREPHEALSERELDVFRMIARGTRLKEIAVRLDLSEKTITTHRRNLLDKLGMENNAELVEYAIRHRLLP